jgi:hypothetical protein
VRTAHLSLDRHSSTAPFRGWIPLIDITMLTVHRQFGKLMKRSADESQVSVLLKDFDQADKLLTRVRMHRAVFVNNFFFFFSIFCFVFGTVPDSVLELQHAMVS